MSVVISICIGIAILFIAFFAGIEVAFANANRLSIELKKKQGSSSGILLSKLLDEPSRFIGTVLVGFNFFLVVFVLLVSIFWNIPRNSGKNMRTFTCFSRKHSRGTSDSLFGSRNNNVILNNSKKRVYI